MENASKALLIAGGVLMTIVIVSALMYMFNEYKSIPKTQEEIKTAEQLAEFNKKYESYNKKNMYGAELISVINMARNNNIANSNNVANYGIDVKVYVKEVKSKVRKWYYDSSEINSSKAVKEYNSGGWPDVKKSISTGWYTLADKNNISSTSLSDEWLEVLNPTLGESRSEYIYVDENENLISGDDIWITETSGTRVYYMKTNLAYEFKNKKFNCTGIEYGANGRVNKISFKEKN